MGLGRLAVSASRLCHCCGSPVNFCSRGSKPVWTRCSKFDGAEISSRFFFFPNMLENPWKPGKPQTRAGCYSWSRKDFKNIKLAHIMCYVELCHLLIFTFIHFSLFITVTLTTSINLHELLKIKHNSRHASGSVAHTWARAHRYQHFDINEDALLYSL